MLRNDKKIEFAGQQTPTIAQFEHLMDQIKFSINLRKHFEVDDEAFWQDLFGRISLRQYKYILALMFSKNYFKLNEVLESLGFKKKAENKTETKIEDIEPF